MVEFIKSVVSQLLSFSYYILKSSSCFKIDSGSSCASVFRVFRNMLYFLILPPMYSFLPSFSVVFCLWVVVSSYKRVWNLERRMSPSWWCHTPLSFFIWLTMLQNVAKESVFFPGKVASSWSYLDAQTSCVYLIALNILFYHCFASSLKFGFLEVWDHILLL